MKTNGPTATTAYPDSSTSSATPAEEPVDSADAGRWPAGISGGGHAGSASWRRTSEPPRPPRRWTNISTASADDPPIALTPP